MAIDRREGILARLAVVLSEVPGVVKSGRNIEDVSGRARPALIIHDAGEDSADLPNRPFRSNNDIMLLSPQVYILLGDRATVVGSRVSEFRSALIVLVQTDSQLNDLVTTNGEIRYMGCGLDTTTGETREARLEMRFQFRYPLTLRELQS